ncbi:hypothetical protein [Streptomyces sp. NPDC058603]|uniref:hypothetical protein n=1 Tax=unclassified Streptomyces TaxID=2593676 RepID=UPI00365A7257
MSQFVESAIARWLTSSGPDPAVTSEAWSHGRPAMLRTGGVYDGALMVWTEFLDCAEGVQSVRVRDAAEDMRVRLARHSHDSTARELAERAGRLLAP